jgi:hypothetical protein
MSTYQVACCDCKATFTIVYYLFPGLLYFCCDCGSRNIVVAKQEEFFSSSERKAVH